MQRELAAAQKQWSHSEGQLAEALRHSRSTHFPEPTPCVKQSMQPELLADSVSRVIAPAASTGYKHAAILSLALLLLMLLLSSRRHDSAKTLIVHQLHALQKECAIQAVWCCRDLQGQLAEGNAQIKVNSCQCPSMLYKF